MQKLLALMVVVDKPMLPKLSSLSFEVNDLKWSIIILFYLFGCLFICLFFYLLLLFIFCYYLLLFIIFSGSSVSCISGCEFSFSDNQTPKITSVSTNGDYAALAITLAGSGDLFRHFYRYAWFVIDSWRYVAVQNYTLLKTSDVIGSIPWLATFHA